MSPARAHDLRLFAGGPRITFVVGAEEPTIYIGEQPITLTQLEELYGRAQDFDFDNGEDQE